MLRTEFTRSWLEPDDLDMLERVLEKARHPSDTLVDLEARAAAAVRLAQSGIKDERSLLAVLAFFGTG